MTKTRKNGYLDPNFSVEDISHGLYGRAKTSVGSIDLVNKMGLLGCLNDIHNTDPTNFAIESTRLLGESDLLGNFVVQGLEEINHTYKTLAVIKDRYSVEGLDPYKFGAEAGIGEILKKAWNAIVVAFKKIVQSISNFVRSIANTIGSQLAKGQESIMEKYNDLDSSAKKGTGAKKVKVALPSGPGKFTSLFTDIQSGIATITNTFTKINAEIEKDQNIAPGKKEVWESDTDLLGKIDLFKPAGSKYKTLSSQGLVNLYIFGKEKVEPKETDPSVVIKTVGIAFLSKKQLEAANGLVKASKELIKTMNESIKAAIKASGEAAKIAGKEKDKTTQKMQQKNRKALRALSWERNWGGKFTGLVISGFSAFLRTRGYVAAAAKSIIAKANKGE